MCVPDTWCQGPALLQVLAILEGFDLPALGHNSAGYLHVLAESVKLAFLVLPEAKLPLLALSV